jgi:hypothetical protein
MAEVWHRNGLGIGLQAPGNVALTLEGQETKCSRTSWISEQDCASEGG